MTDLMQWTGIVLLALSGAGIAATGLPAALILILAAIAGAALAIGSGAVPIELVGALPGRLINLMENDLLQALPLYALMGVLMNRLPVADILFRATVAALPRKPSAPLVSGLALGALLGPMNGSVGASVMALSRVVAPRLRQMGVAPAQSAATIAVASTMGVVVPPSLVLILLGDAMLSAHTIAVTTTGRDDRVINTQDVFHSALAPAALFFVVTLLLAWRFGTRTSAAEDTPVAPTRLSRREGLIAASVISGILVLLGGVAAGRFYAVEAAAMGAVGLVIGGWFSGHLSIAVLRTALADVIALTGALFFLLVAATTLTLVLRMLGTDQLVGAWITAMPGGDSAAVAIVLAAIALSALVLDAFEIIFVIVPIVIPPLLIRVADARWISALLLLTLQTSFLLPPFGYALLLVRGLLPDHIPLKALARALAPFLIAQTAILAALIAFPMLTHLGQDGASRSRKPPATLSTDELNRKLNDMLPPPPPLEPIR